MTQPQYRQFLNDPVTFLNAGPVFRFRINMNPTGVGFSNSMERTEHFAGAVPTQFQYSDARVAQVFLRYDNTGIPPTSAVWAQSARPPGGAYVGDRAYYLQWSADQAYAISLGQEAQLFFTAQVDGCGILLFETPEKLIVVHHNIQVPVVGQTVWQYLTESQATFDDRDRENRFDSRAAALQSLAHQIVAANPTIIGGAALDSRQYMSTGNPASIFGVKRGGHWRIFVNSKTGANYHTQLMYG